jgi:hypothetical protein
LLEISEQACADRARHGHGYSFAKIVWRQRMWLVWYLATGDEITLMSIRPDLT